MTIGVMQFQYTSCAAETQNLLYAFLYLIRGKSRCSRVADPAKSPQTSQPIQAPKASEASNAAQASQAPNRASSSVEAGGILKAKRFALWASLLSLQIWMLVPNTDQILYRQENFIEQEDILYRTRRNII